MVLVVEPDVAAEYVLWELYGLQAVCYVPVLDVGIEVAPTILVITADNYGVVAGSFVVAARLNGKTSRQVIESALDLVTGAPKE